MCGIVGYVGSNQAYPVVLKELKRLEYRGYDSAGVALLNSGSHVYMKNGKVANLADELIAPLINVIPLQLLAYHIGVLQGCDVDKPRNLAKSVTVE